MKFAAKQLRVQPVNGHIRLVYVQAGKVLLSKRNDTWTRLQDRCI